MTCQQCSCAVEVRKRLNWSECRNCRSSFNNGYDCECDSYDCSFCVNCDTIVGECNRCHLYAPESDRNYNCNRCTTIEYDKRCVILRTKHLNCDFRTESANLQFKARCLCGSDVGGWMNCDHVAIYNRSLINENTILQCINCDPSTENCIYEQYIDSKFYAVTKFIGWRLSCVKKQCVKCDCLYQGPYYKHLEFWASTMNYCVDCNPSTKNVKCVWDKKMHTWVIRLHKTINLNKHAWLLVDDSIDLNYKCCCHKCN